MFKQYVYNPNELEKSISAVSELAHQKILKKRPQSVTKKRYDPNMTVSTSLSPANRLNINHLTEEHNLTV